jgi:hypothetical protein
MRSPFSNNALRPLKPWELPGPVVLDATARVDLMYQLMEDRADIIPTPPGVRDYSNVTLHVARTTSIGKTKMEELAAIRFPRLQAALSQRLTPDCKVLFCVHKNVEHLVPLQADLGVEAVASVHWGAVDGSNAYKDFDTAVIFGLPFQDHIWGTGTFFAFQGVQDDDWHDNPSWKNCANIRELLQRRHLAASIIQAMGRVVRERWSTDRAGVSEQRCSSFCRKASAARKSFSIFAKTYRTSPWPIGPLNRMARRCEESALVSRMSAC